MILFCRTDFFIECPPEGGPHGFIKGQAEALIVTKFRKFKEMQKPLEIITENKVNLPSVSTTAPKDVQRTAAPESKLENEPLMNPSRSMRSEPAECDSHNGRVTEKYSWSQTIDEMDVTIPVGTEIKKGKQVHVEIKATELRVNLVGSDDPIVHGKFAFPVKKDDCYWALVPGEVIRISLQKGKDRFSNIFKSSI